MTRNPLAIRDPFAVLRGRGGYPVDVPAWGVVTLRGEDELQRSRSIPLNRDWTYEGGTDRQRMAA